MVFDDEHVRMITHDRILLYWFYRRHIKYNLNTLN
jgi:hypothetical protein